MWICVPRFKKKKKKKAALEIIGILKNKKGW